MKCVKCGEDFSKEDIRDLKDMGEEFHTHPFICPDCWDNLQGKDLEDQFKELMEEKR